MMCVMRSFKKCFSDQRIRVEVEAMPEIHFVSCLLLKWDRKLLLTCSGP